MKRPLKRIDERHLFYEYPERKETDWMSWFPDQLLWIDYSTSGWKHDSLYRAKSKSPWGKLTADVVILRSMFRDVDRDARSLGHLLVGACINMVVFLVLVLAGWLYYY